MSDKEIVRKKHSHRSKKHSNTIITFFNVQVRSAVLIVSPVNPPIFTGTEEGLVYKLRSKKQYSSDDNNNMSST